MLLPKRFWAEMKVTGLTAVGCGEVLLNNLTELRVLVAVTL